MDTNGTLLASTSAVIRTAGDTVVVGTMDVILVERCGFDEDGESGEENEGGEELHDDPDTERSVGENVVVRRKEENTFEKGSQRGAKRIAETSAHGLATRFPGERRDEPAEISQDVPLLEEHGTQIFLEDFY